MRVLIPEKGVSALDIEGGPFFDPEADAALFNALERTMHPNANRRIERLPLHINDPKFARAAVEAYRAFANCGRDTRQTWVSGPEVSRQTCHL